jgi:predicted RNase H-like HicB family nuclease
VSTRARRTRSSTWHNTASAISTVVSSTSTDDPLSSLVTVPMPTLHLVFGGDADGELSLIRPEAPRIAKLASSMPDAAGLACCSIDRDQPLPKHPHRIELSIDSLPNYMLIEPIPVAIDPLGDNAFTAWVPNLETNATGQSVVEALLMLKERIELVYDDLDRRTQLSNDEKMTLQMLHTYITPKKPEWV